MSLLERIQKAETCAVVDCPNRRAADAEVCAADLTELFMNRLDRDAGGAYRRRRVLRARDETAWTRGAAA